MKASKLNRELIKQIIDIIEDEPKRLEMSTWVLNPLKSQQAPSCGTTGCIAGWAVMLNLRRDAVLAKRKIDAEKIYDRLNKRNKDMEGEGMRLLGLPYDIAPTVFYYDQWPEPFQRRYMAAATPKARARATVARLRHLLNRGE
jgi:hypothetical protein